MAQVFKNPADQAATMKPTANKYNLKPTDQIRPSRIGSLSQEIGSSYDHMSDLLGLDFNDLVYGDKGFMKTKYPEGFPDFKGDVIYSDKYYKEFEDWLENEKKLNLKDRYWERYKLDPDYFENSYDPEYYRAIREYGKTIEPDHPIHQRPAVKDMWW